MWVMLSKQHLKGWPSVSCSSSELYHKPSKPSRPYASMLVLGAKNKEESNVYPDLVNRSPVNVLFYSNFYCRGHGLGFVQQASIRFLSGGSDFHLDLVCASLQALLHRDFSSGLAHGYL